MCGNIHIYVLPETLDCQHALGSDPSVAYVYPPNPLPSPYTNACDVPGSYYCYADHDKLSLFDAQVRLMRQWMKDHSQQDKRCLLSEFGILYDENRDGMNTAELHHGARHDVSEHYVHVSGDQSDAVLGCRQMGNRLASSGPGFSANNGTTGLGQ